ncbi:putative COP9 signalosome complex subunit 5 [Blattamonas nauphoetae]|uniref:COP9 signalosome complex subunit 5 n=1 Tax=Blattamonas nauphoetae TaxID=2049346 RepID=A0ABQ9YHH6_9EUKA|nr:putative COP9 signalosome complex subunit 5 [Blattamonas nauphoetae]
MAVPSTNWESELYTYDVKTSHDFLFSQPHTNDPLYFSQVKVSAVALLKIVMHACNGGNLEIMGLLSGRIIPHAFIIMDALPLPIEGTETRVTADDETAQYMIRYMESSEKVGRKENVVGWYHSHPGFGCWMSGIDCDTQSLNQQLGAYVAIVVDPYRTMASGRVEIGAFRTYPIGYVPPKDRGDNPYITIPTGKIDDWGKQANRYYKLETSFFKSATDIQVMEQLAKKSWTNTLTTSALVVNSSYFTLQAQEQVQMITGEGGTGSKKSDKTQLRKASMKALSEQSPALATHILKHLIFVKQ